MAGTNELNQLASSLSGRMEVPAGPVAVALSGGADSAALLWLVTRTAEDVVGIHVFHGLPASAVMSTAAGQVAAMCGVRMEMVVVEPEGTAEHHLRDARLAALLDRAGDHPILFGHTLDDQAETVLMRALRGTGIDGLAGIAPRRGRLHHPMLGIRRDETRRLAELAGLPFRDDPSNKDPIVVRNRIRHELLPLADDVMERDVRLPLARLAANAAEEIDPRLVRMETDGRRLRVALGELRATTRAAAQIRRSVAAWTKGYPPSRAAIERVLQVVSGAVVATEIEGNLTCRRQDGFLVFSERDSGIEPSPDAARLGVGDQAWGGWRFRVERIEGPTAVPISNRSLVVPEGSSLEVRAHSDDDRVTGRSVSDALTDARVSIDDRPGWPVVLIDGDPAWIPLVRGRRWPTHLPGGYLSISAYREPRWEKYEP